MSLPRIQESSRSCENCAILQKMIDAPEKEIKLLQTEIRAAVEDSEGRVPFWG